MAKKTRLGLDGYGVRRRKVIAVTSSATGSASGAGTATATGSAMALAAGSASGVGTAAGVSAVALGPVYLDPAQLGPTIVLSNANLTATQTAASTGNTRAIAHHNSGDYYHEFTVNTAGDMKVGLCRAELPLTEYLGEDPGVSIGVDDSGGWIGAGGTTTAPALIAGHTYGMATHIDGVGGGAAWLKDITAGGNWNADASANPVTGVNGATFFVSGPWVATMAALVEQIMDNGGIPGTHPSPPTVTHTDYASDAGTLGGTLYNWDEAVYRVTGGVTLVVPGAYPNTLLGNINQSHYNGTDNMGSRGEWHFVVNGPSFEFAHKNIGGSLCRVLVDGQYATTIMPQWSADGNFSWTKLAFSGAASREITIEADGNFWFYGVLPGSSYAVTTAPTPPDPDLRMVTLGDSFAEAAFCHDNWAGRCAHLLGIRDHWISAVGGTGWVKTNGSYVSLHARWNDDAVASLPDIALICSGYNDIGQGTDATVAANALADIAALRAAKPECLVVVVGPWNPVAPSAPAAGYAAIKTALQDAIAGLEGCLFVDMQGVAYAQIGGADIHPNAAGHVTIGNYVADAIKVWAGVYASKLDGAAASVKDGANNSILIRIS